MYEKVYENLSKTFIPNKLYQKKFINNYPYISFSFKLVKDKSILENKRIFEKITASKFLFDFASVYLVLLVVTISMLWRNEFINNFF